jgi:preprotein translocase subunit Sss1
MGLSVRNKNQLTLKNIERIFRASKEYKQFVTMIRQEYDGEYCRITKRTLYGCRSRVTSLSTYII